MADHLLGYNETLHQCSAFICGIGQGWGNALVGGKPWTNLFVVGHIPGRRQTAGEREMGIRPLEKSARAWYRQASHSARCACSTPVEGISRPYRQHDDHGAALG